MWVAPGFLSIRLRKECPSYYLTAYVSHTLGQMIEGPPPHAHCRMAQDPAAEGKCPSLKTQHPLAPVGLIMRRRAMHCALTLATAHHAARLEKSLPARLPINRASRADRRERHFKRSEAERSCLERRDRRRASEEAEDSRRPGRAALRSEAEMPRDTEQAAGQADENTPTPTRVISTGLFLGLVSKGW